MFFITAKINVRDVGKVSQNVHYKKKLFIVFVATTVEDLRITTRTGDLFVLSEARRGLGMEWMITYPRINRGKHHLTLIDPKKRFLHSFILR